MQPEVDDISLSWYACKESEMRIAYNMKAKEVKTCVTIQFANIYLSYI